MDFARGRVHAWTSSSPDGRSGWRRGWHPLPHVLYENYPIGPKGKSRRAVAMKRAFARLGIPVFNPSFFNKAELQRLLSASEVRRFLPAGKAARSVSDVTGLLRRHRSVYLKPVNGTQGRGILELKRRSHGRVKVKSGKRADRVGRKEFTRIMSRLLRRERYLVQEGLSLRKKDGTKSTSASSSTGEPTAAGIRPASAPSSADPGPSLPTSMPAAPRRPGPACPPGPAEAENRFRPPDGWKRPPWWRGASLPASVRP
ncbi:YheC/YheD family protein [Paenibacillus sp. CC-CFT747]|nr:YheC/YheD family protein [Paenibacillus sp. CC-CFT747]